MTTVKEHYENHLAYFYAWMTGDFEEQCKAFKNFLEANLIRPQANKIAVDLGAGHGIQSIALAESGFKVIAIDFNRHLLNQLEINAKHLDILTIYADIREVKTFTDKAELIVCCGDTLLHLEDKEQVKSFISDMAQSLSDNGKVILSFRDYTRELHGAERYIPVKSDDTKILTCILNYEKECVNVTDLLHEKTENGWKQKVSMYKKVRLLPDEIITYLEASGLKIIFNGPVNRLITIIACK